MMKYCLLLLTGLVYTTTARAQLVNSTKQSDSLQTSKGPFVPLAQGKDTQGAYSMSEVTALRLNAPLHPHKTDSESFYVLAGHLTVYVDGRTHRLGPGSFLLVPQGTPHTMGNADAQPVRFLITVTPSSLFDQQIAEQA